MIKLTAAGQLPALVTLNRSRASQIPVVEHFDEHDELLAGLPVVRVTDWSTLTPERLQKEWTRIRHATHAGSLSWTKLYLPFWLHTFVAHMRPSDTGT